MKKLEVLASAVLAASALSACASNRAPKLVASSDAGPAQVSTSLMPGQAALPSDTIIQVTPVQEITSIKMVEGDQHMLQTAVDVSHNGIVVIPRGAPVRGTVTYRTGKGIGGKSAKFEMTFNTVSVGGREYALKGKHRQEGRGNTVGALLGSMWISGKSAIMSSGQLVNAFTAEPIPVS